VADVFVSYSRKDKAFVSRLAAALIERENDVWVDWEDIPATADWDDEIRGGIDAAHSFCFVISPDSLASSVCARELDYATAERKRLVPLLRRETDGVAVPQALADRNWIFFRDDDSFDQALDTLQRALDTDLERVREHTRLVVRAHEWDQRSQDSSVLLRGDDLRQAERFLAAEDDHEPQPTPLQRQYVLASRRESSKRQRRLLVAAMVAVAVSLALALFALVQRNAARHQARNATSRALAAEATARLGSDPALSVVLALEATRVAETPQATRSLRTAVVESRLRRVLRERGSTGIEAVAFSPKGDRIVSTHGTGVRIWDAATGRRLLSFVDASYQPHKVIAFGPDDETILVAPDRDAESCSSGTCGDRTVRLWRIGDLEPRTLTHSDAATGAAFVSRNRIVTGSADGTVHLWSTGEHPHVVGQLGSEGGHPVTPFASANGRWILAVADNGATKVWRLEPRQQLVFTLPPIPVGQDGYRRAAAITDDGAFAAVAREEGVVALIALGRRPHVVARLTGHTHPVSSLAFSADGSLLATAAGTGYFFTFDGEARVWSTRDGSLVTSLGGHTGPITSVSFAPRTGVILTTSDDGYGRVWTADGRLLAVLRGHTKGIVSAAFAPDGRTIVTGSEDRTIRIWDAGIGREPRAAGVASVTGAAALSPDRTRLALDAGSRSVIWNLDTGKHTVLAGSRAASTISFDPRGRRVVVGSLGGARVFAADGRPLTQFLKTHSKYGEVTSAALSPDGEWAVTAGTNEVDHRAERISLWRLRGGAATQASTLATGATSNAVSSFSPDGRWLITDKDIDFAVWDMQRRKTVEIPPASMLGLPAVFSRDGRTVVTPMGPTVWRPGRWSKRVCEGDDFAAVSALALSNDTRTVATGGYRGEIILRDARTCRIEQALDTAGTGVEEVGFSPDDRFLVSAAGSLVRVTDLNTEEDVARFVVPGVVHAGFAGDDEHVWATSATTRGGDGEARLFRCIGCGSIDHLRREALRLERVRPLDRSELKTYESN
jgi:WD40 repeat protein